MADLFKRLPEGTGKTVNKKQLKDFIREVLFSKGLHEIEELEQMDCSEWPAATAVIIQTALSAIKAGDFSKLRPVLDFAFERDVIKTGKRR